MAKLQPKKKQPPAKSANTKKKDAMTAAVAKKTVPLPAKKEVTGTKKAAEGVGKANQIAKTSKVIKKPSSAAKGKSSGKGSKAKLAPKKSPQKKTVTTKVAVPADKKPVAIPEKRSKKKSSAKKGGSK